MKTTTWSMVILIALLGVTLPRAAHAITLRLDFDFQEDPNAGGGLPDTVDPVFLAYPGPTEAINFGAFDWDAVTYPLTLVADSSTPGFAGVAAALSDGVDTDLFFIPMGYGGGPFGLESALFGTLPGSPDLAGFDITEIRLTFTRLDLTEDQIGDVGIDTAGYLEVFGVEPADPQDPPTNAIPEPATAGLLGLAAMGLLARRRRVV